MAKTKVLEPRVALPGEKKSKAPKASQTARAKPASLSADLVVESGSEPDSGTEGGGSDSESEQEKRQNTTKPDIRRVKATEPAIPAVPDDTSSEEEEEEEDEEESSSDDELPEVGAKVAAKTPTKLQRPTTNGVKRKVDDSSSSEEEAEVDPEVLPDAPPQKKSRIEAQTTVAPSLPTEPFNAPAGYTRVPKLPPSSIPQASLAGKQIWHITAPSHLPLSALTEVSLEAIQNATPVLTHKSARYSLTALPSATPSTVLLPTPEGYTPVAQPITRTLQIREVVELPELSVKQASQLTGSEKAAEVKVPAVSRVREQPRGLKMRYRPPGFGKGEAGRTGSGSDSDAENGDVEMSATVEEKRGFKHAKAILEVVPGVHEKTKENFLDSTPAKEKRKKEKSKEKANHKVKRKSMDA